MKEKTRLFLRTTVISLLLILSMSFGTLGICKAYESIRFIGFGEYKNAIEISKEKIKILDFEIKF